tara:strand:+ start:351 stop:965 length:615 start_codon:yes stop_codon:yes gene_type:complete
VTQQVGEHVTVTATVAGHELYKDKPMTKLHVPGWTRDYPLNLYNVDPAVQGQMPMGATLNIILERSNLKKDKDPQYPTSWFWNLIGPTDAPATPPSAPPLAQRTAAAPMPPQQSFVDREAVRDRNIARQVALKAAVDWLSNPLQINKDPGLLDVVGAAEAFYAFIAAPDVPSPAQQPQPHATVTTAAPAGEPEQPEHPADDPPF